LIRGLRHVCTISEARFGARLFVFSESPNWVGLESVIKNERRETMQEQVYQELCQKMVKRGGRYPGMDIPEFYNIVKELFTHEEAAVFNAIPKGYHPANSIAANLDKSEQEISAILEDMADKGLVFAGEMGGTFFYGVAPLDNIFDFQFMRGTNTERDKKLAKLHHVYKKAVDDAKGPPTVNFPITRVIPIDHKIKVGNTVHTYQQVASYIEKYDPLAVSTCYCRQEAKLVDENDICDKPFEVCMTFGMAAQFIIDRGIGRKISKEEATDILKKSEESGLVHCTLNRQEIDFLCNCCKCHCIILDTAFSQPKPGLILNSGFHPTWDPKLCETCETCIENCPTTALAMGNENLPIVNLDLCIGCGICATGCPEEAISLVEREEILIPPMDQKALAEAVKKADRAG
jgi:Pyruvate/2-oxoacid:ferredoxin oxidoreductase delta subunit